MSNVQHTCELRDHELDQVTGGGTKGTSQPQKLTKNLVLNLGSQI